MKKSELRTKAGKIFKGVELEFFNDLIDTMSTNEEVKKTLEDSDGIKKMMERRFRTGKM
ncbi:hypothetical protein [Paenibacillus donghaensis]|uniref:hypothetical protein n=1 Tax=Paenibacillus donghaensis TaxID=414771 RepID=UPI0012FD1216|nr:hypothetical protein [Paenibacillus donghaensis]